MEHIRLLAQETEELAKQEELDWQLLALWITFWLTDRLQGQGGLLVDRLLLAKQQALIAGDHLAASRVMRWLTFAYGSARRLHMVYQESLDTLALMEQIGEYSAMAGYLHFMLADCYYSWRIVSKRHRPNFNMLSIADTWQQADLLIVGKLFVVSVALANNDLAVAEEALHAAEALAQQQRDAYHHRLVVAEQGGVLAGSGRSPSRTCLGGAGSLHAGDMGSHPRNGVSDAHSRESRAWAVC